MRVNLVLFARQKKSHCLGFVAFEMETCIMIRDLPLKRTEPLCILHYSLEEISVLVFFPFPPVGYHTQNLHLHQIQRSRCVVLRTQTQLFSLW